MNNKAEPGLRLPASVSALGRASHPAGRGPSLSSLFLPLAAVASAAEIEKDRHTNVKRQSPTVDIPEDWNPRAKQQPTGLIAYGASHRRPVQVLLSAQKNTAHFVCCVFSAVKQSKSEPFSFDAAWAASSNVMVCVPSL